MQAKVKCKIDSVRRVTHDEKTVELTLSTIDGNTVSANGNKLKCVFQGTLNVKEVVAAKLRIGATILLDVSVEEDNSI